MKPLLVQQTPLHHPVMFLPVPAKVHPAHWPHASGCPPSWQSASWAWAKPQWWKKQSTPRWTWTVDPHRSWQAHQWWWGTVQKWWRGTWGSCKTGPGFWGPLSERLCKRLAVEQEKWRGLISYKQQQSKGVFVNFFSSQTLLQLQKIHWELEAHQQHLVCFLDQRLLACCLPVKQHIIPFLHVFGYIFSPFFCFTSLFSDHFHWLPWNSLHPIHIAYLSPLFISSSYSVPLPSVTFPVP